MMYFIAFGLNLFHPHPLLVGGGIPPSAAAAAAFSHLQQQQQQHGDGVPASPSLAAPTTSITAPSRSAFTATSSSSNSDSPALKAALQLPLTSTYK